MPALEKSPLTGYTQRARKHMQLRTPPSQAGVPHEVQRMALTRQGLRKVRARFLGLCLLELMLSGCVSLLPQSEELTKSKWASYEEVKAAFDRIALHETGIDELKQLGFDPNHNPNVRILTYLDLIEKFIPNQSISLQDLDPAVRSCIEARDKAQAWAIDLNETKSRRYGNVVLDVTGFVKKTHETGWQFSGLLLVQNQRVVYKLSSGRPNVDRNARQIKPLGPLQDLEGLVVRGINSVW